MSMLHIALWKNFGCEHHLAKSDAGASTCTIYLTVDFDAKKLACQAAIGDLEFFCELGLHFDLSGGCIFHVQH